LILDKELFRKTEELLSDYKTLIVEAENIKIAMEEGKKECKGCSAITYEEKTGPNNKFNSTVENEIIVKDKHMVRNLKQSKH
jgi:hypothetical protein